MDSLVTQITIGDTGQAVDLPVGWPGYVVEWHVYTRYTNGNRKLSACMFRPLGGADWMLAGLTNLDYLMTTSGSHDVPLALADQVRVSERCRTFGG